ncbi:MAG: VacJ family lipoprotein [Rhodovibrionaceae bacterium]
MSSAKPAPKNRIFDLLAAAVLTGALVGCTYLPLETREVPVQAVAVESPTELSDAQALQAGGAPSPAEIQTAAAAQSDSPPAQSAVRPADELDNAFGLTRTSQELQGHQLAQASDIGGPDGAEDDGDPLEIFNRFMFAINDTVDIFILKPIAVTYEFWVPEGVRNSVRNFLRNLRTPVTLANDLFQGEMHRAEATLARFFINSTVGLAGLFDIAGDSGWDYHSEDFGQTMAVYGAGEGFYLVLPLIGPSSARDGAGRVVDHFLDPLTYLLPMEYNLGRAGMTAVDFRSRNLDLIEDMKRDSIDYYARIRSLYRQTRLHEISNGEAGDAPGPAVSKSSDEISQLQQ